MLSSLCFPCTFLTILNYLFFFFAGDKLDVEGERRNFLRVESSVDAAATSSQRLCNVGVVLAKKAFGQYGVPAKKAFGRNCVPAKNAFGQYGVLAKKAFGRYCVPAKKAFGQYGVLANKMFSRYRILTKKIFGQYGVLAKKAHG